MLHFIKVFKRLTFMLTGVLLSPLIMANNDLPTQKELLHEEKMPSEWPPFIEEKWEDGYYQGEGMAH